MRRAFFWLLLFLSAVWTAAIYQAVLHYRSHLGEFVFLLAVLLSWAVFAIPILLLAYFARPNWHPFKDFAGMAVTAFIFLFISALPDNTASSDSQLSNSPPRAVPTTQSVIARPAEKLAASAEGPSKTDKPALREEEVAGTAKGACYDTPGGMTICTPRDDRFFGRSDDGNGELFSSARRRVQSYANGEGWHRAFLKQARVSHDGNLCGTLYGETDETYGWNFTVRFVYYPSSNDIDVENWALLNHQPDFDATWNVYCR